MTLFRPPTLSQQSISPCVHGNQIAHRFGGTPSLRPHYLPGPKPAISPCSCRGPSSPSLCSNSLSIGHSLPSPSSLSLRLSPFFQPPSSTLPTAQIGQA